MESLTLKAMGNGLGLPPPAAALPSGGQTTSSPCAGCKFLRRKCQPDCVFAPYFPPDQPQKFANVHRVFGASNVTKILNELHPFQREDAVNSLAYEAEMRLRDPVYGCVGIISLLQRQLRQLQIDLSRARTELSRYQSVAGTGIGMEQQRMMMLRGYTSSATEFSGNLDYDADLMAAAVGMGLSGGGGGQFTRPEMAGGDDRHSALETS